MKSGWIFCAIMPTFGAIGARFFTEWLGIGWNIGGTIGLATACALLAYRDGLADAKYRYRP